MPAPRYVLDNKSVAINDQDWTFDCRTSVYDFLKADYDIQQGINTMIYHLPVAPSIGWVKGHQDNHTPWDKLSLKAKANCHADHVCTETHSAPTATVRSFPEWIPGTAAALYHNGRLVTKKLEEYVTTAATAPRHRKYLTERSMKRDRTIPNDWHDDTFDDIDWKSIGSSMKAMTIGRRIQISKFTHEWNPHAHNLATRDNKIDRRCFACRHLREDTDHIYRCPSERRQAARLKATSDFHNHLSRYFTPAPMAALLKKCIEHWLAGREPQHELPLSTTDTATSELHHLINVAYEHQNYIGWGHFFRGRLSLQWRAVIACYYKECQPGDRYTPKLWMRKTIDQLWQFYLTIWHCRNGEKHGIDYDEAQAKALRATRQEARRVYIAAQNEDLNNQEARLLHARPINTILNWTKSHLDAYLATAEVILEQNVDPG